MRHGNGFKDITGQRFARLTVLRFHKTERRKASWLCRCVCGKTAIVVGSKLRNGWTKSCGCLEKEQRPFKHRTHGKRHTSEYNIWASMRQRCNNPNFSQFHHYGGRGIRICPAWDRFEQFLSDMGPRPSLAHSIERVDNDGDYTPTNCVWATADQQQSNKRTNRLLTWNGTTLPMITWAKRRKMPYHRLYARWKLGWTAEQILTFARCQNRYGTTRPKHPLVTP